MTWDDQDIMESQIENLKIEQKPSPAETRINSSRFQFADSNCREFRLIEYLQLFPPSGSRRVEGAFTFHLHFPTDFTHFTNFVTKIYFFAKKSFKCPSDIVTLL